MSHLRRLTMAVWLCAGMAASLPAAAQESKPAPGGLFGQIGRWFDSVGDQLRDAGRGVDNFGREAGTAARTTANAAGDAATAVVRIPETRVVAGHEACAIADNGAPDCRSAADRLCKSKGMKAGRSLDITAAEDCPMRVTLGEREAQPGECKNITFVSRALCQ
jgi:hypothetical protein